MAWSHTFVEIDHEIILPCADSKSAEHRQLQAKNIYTKYCQACPGKSVVRRTKPLDMTIAFDFGVKSQIMQKRWKQREQNKKTIDSI